MATTEVLIEKWVYGGAGLARIDGEVVLTPYVLPGERALIEPAVRRGGVSRADLVSIEEPSPERVLPACPYFGRCGGCQYQHAGYAHQLALKLDILREQLRRVGRMEPPENIDVISGPEWEYRNRAQLHYAGGRIGYLEAGTHQLCPIEKCPISSPRLNAAIAVLNRMARDRRWPRFLRRFELFTNEQQMQFNVLESDQPIGKRFFEWAEQELGTPLGEPIDYTAAAATYRVGRRSFFQVNRFLIDPLVTAALAGCRGQRALDLYAGAGLFSLPLADAFDEVIAVESGSGAVDDLQYNSLRAGSHVTAVKADTEQFLTAFDAAVDFVIADPPRTGLGKKVVAELLRIRPQNLVVVACDPSTLARDLSVLTAAGYRVHGMTLVDLFPQTFHLETVVRLTCGGS